MLLFDLVYEVVQEREPDELPFLAGLRGADDAQVARRLSGDRRRGDPLGFGMGEVVIVVTPIVWPVVQKVADRIGDQIADAVVDEGSSKLRKVLRRKRRGRHRKGPQPLPRFGTDDLKLVEDDIVKLGVQRGLDHDDAVELARAVTRRLAPEAADGAKG